MKKRQLRRGNVEKVQEKETGKGIKRHRTNVGKEKIESNREDFFSSCIFLLVIQGSQTELHGENSGSL